MSSTNFEAVLGAQADAIIKKYPQSRSAVMPLLHMVQEHDNHIGPAAIEWIAAKLGLQPINVWELVTFYPSYKEEPKGKLHIRMCKTLSCMLNGAAQSGQVVSETLACLPGQTRDDGAVSIEWVECLACCDKGPVALVNNELHTHITPEKAGQWAQSLPVPAVANT